MDVSPIGNPAQSLTTAADLRGANWLAENRELIRSIKSMDTYASELFGEGNELTFALDRDTKRPVVRVIDGQTGDMLWEAPPEYVLRLAQILGRKDG